MQHRDKIILQKILSEIDIAFDMLGEADQDEFLKDEKLKRAVGMTVINIGELVKNVSDELRVVLSRPKFKLSNELVNSIVTLKTGYFMRLLWKNETMKMLILLQEI